MNGYQGARNSARAREAVKRCNAGSLLKLGSSGDLAQLNHGSQTAMGRRRPIKTSTRLNKCLKATFIPSGDDLSSCCLPGCDSLGRLIPFLSHLTLILSCWVNNAPPAFDYCCMAGPDMKETAWSLWHLSMRRAFSVSRASMDG
ncbi:uncharacterized protein [Danio rerio]|uniref:Uncharacterized protein n=1 Tax=Danio rerio TaxID=7955 RepID=A0AC58IFB6_DANRE